MSIELRHVSGPPGPLEYAVDSSPPASQQADNEESSLADGISTESSHAPLQTGEDFEAWDFAQIASLAQWFPQVKEDEESKSWRIWMSRRSRALLLQISLICTIFTTNVVLTILAVLRFSSKDGVGLIYEGNCTTVARLNLWIHLLINILSTGMLSASNYCMQLQGAPTRDNVNKAHDNDTWVDIGVPSLRNLRYIGRWRILSWSILAITSLPMHLLYNSAVFQSLTSFEYTVAVVKNSFLNGSSWDLHQAEIRRGNDPAWGNDTRVNFPANYTEIILEMQMNATRDEYTQLNVSSCFDLYDDYFAPQGNVVVLVKNQSIQEPPNDSLFLYVGIMPRSDNWAKNMWALENGTAEFVLQSPPKPVNTWLLGLPRYEVDYCLVQKPALDTKVCRFEYSPWIMYIVCAFNLAKATTIFIIWGLRKWQNRNEDVLFTLGDAIASFMKDPDDKTKGLCMATKYDFITSRTWRNRLRKSQLELPTEGRRWVEKRWRWGQSASPHRWVMLISTFSAVIILVIVLLFLSMVSLRHRSIPTTISYFWSMGFGQLRAYTYLTIGLPREDPTGLIANVLLSNLPQLILSILYIFYNSMLSTFLVQREFSRMYKEERRKPLRVSEPIGIQRSSYFISLPLRFGVPLYASSGLMHWLISSSLFLARITTLRPGDASIDPANSFSTCGYSPIAIIIALLVGSCLIITIVTIGLCCKYDGIMRIVSTNSLAISAACHCPEGDRRDGYKLPVRWGVVQAQGHDGHCAFTTAPSDQVRVPDTVTVYK